ncbi:MAG: hypothetical protein QXW91_05075 [Candidatus Nitrosotenuis sp.]
MDVDFNVMSLLTNRQLDLILNVNGVLHNVRATITLSDVPVRKPTMRGGVYYTDKSVFKIKASVNDDSISKLLSQAMLGPNADFEQIELLAPMEGVRIFANLTNYVQKNAGLELNLVVVGTESLN